MSFFSHSHFQGFEFFGDQSGFSELLIKIFECESVVIEKVFFFTVFKECNPGIGSTELIQLFFSWRSHGRKSRK